jgi:hypothetical protein
LGDEFLNYSLQNSAYFIFFFNHAYFLPFSVLHLLLNIFYLTRKIVLATKDRQIIVAAREWCAIHNFVSYFV